MIARPTDRELLDLAAAGDGEAWGVLWRRHRAALHALAMSFLADEMAAEDVVACAFERAHGALGRAFDGEHVGAWLCRITTNCAIDEIRRAGSRERAALLAICERAGQFEPEEAEFRYADLVYERRSLDRAVRMLPPAQQALVHMRLCGLSTREIARSLGCSEAAARVRWVRVLATLRQIIGHHRELSASKGDSL